MFTFAFDFDGVLCDSVNETAYAGWKACRVKWPEIFDGDMEERQLADFSRVRPVLKTGYESMILNYLLKAGNSVQQILEDYDHLKEIFYNETGVSVEELKDLLGGARDNWIENDFDSWLAVNSFYDGVIEAVKSCKYPVFIVTTKQKRFAAALCRYAGLELPDENIYGLENGEKSVSLKEIHEKYPDNSILFVEDRLKNLLETSVDGADLHKFYADWGYGTKEDYKKAEENPELTIIRLAVFRNFIDNPADFIK